MPAIPPTEEAVREAMAPPPKAKGGGGKAIVFVAIGMIAVGAGGFLMPKPGQGSQPSPKDMRITEQGTYRSYDHSSGFRILMPLAADRRGRRTELETMIRFSYECLDEQVAPARNSIRRNWRATARALGAEISKYTRLGIVMDLEPLTGSLRRIVDTTMFSNDEARVTSLGWDHLTFRKLQ